MKPVQTPCKNCVFAEYEDITQIGCSAGQLDKFRQNNIEIIEAYDHEKEFYVINGKMCQMSRSASWGIKHPKENWVKVARQETNIKYQVFVVSKGDLEKLASTIKSLYEQEIKPRHIVVISNNQDKHKEILEIFKYQKGSIV